MLTMPTGQSSTRWRPVTRHARQTFGALLALVLLCAGCSSGGSGGSDEPPGQTAEPATGQADDGQPAEPVTIRLGWGFPGQEVFYVMQHVPEAAPNLGVWYEVEWTQLDAPQYARSIAGGVVDGGVIGTLAAANAISEGAELVFTGQFIQEAEGNTPLTWLVRADSGITTPADLAGETIATIGQGASLDYIQDAYLESEAGLVPDQDFEKVEIPFGPQMQEALLAGQAAAGPFPPPFLQQALATGEFEPLFTILDVLPVSVATLQAFDREFVEDNRVTVEKFVEDWVAVHRFIADPANRQQVIEATSAATEIPVEVLESYLLTEEDGIRSPTGALNIEAVQDNWDFFAGRGAFEGELRVEDYLIDELLPPQEGS